MTHRQWKTERSRRTFSPDFVFNFDKLIFSGVYLLCTTTCNKKKLNWFRGIPFVYKQMFNWWTFTKVFQKRRRQKKKWNRWYPVENENKKKLHWMLLSYRTTDSKVKRTSLMVKIKTINSMEMKMKGNKSCKM